MGKIVQNIHDYLLSMNTITIGLNWKQITDGLLLLRIIYTVTLICVRELLCFTNFAFGSVSTDNYSVFNCTIKT